VINKLESKMSDEGYQKAKKLYPKLIDRCIPLSQTPISSRVFMDWRKDKLIDYPETTSSKREWVQLNFFEYIWIIICNDLRDYGMSKKHIIALKEMLVTKTFHDLLKERDVNVEEVKGEIYDQAKTVLHDEEIGKEEFENVMTNPVDFPEEDRYYLTGIGGMIVIVLFTNTHPVLTIRSIGEDMLEVDSVIIDSSEESLNKITSKILSNSTLSIPIRPIIEGFLVGEKKENYANHFQLFNEWEKNVIDLIRTGEFKELVITKCDKEEEKFIVKRTTKNELIGSNVKEIKKLFGLKDYKKVEITYRNDKHIYFENTVVEDL
jgi:hypothetical protein